MLDIIEKDNYYDLILAEGVLNAVGFESGFLKSINLLKSKGYLIIHDEYKNHNNIVDFIKNNNCTIIDTYTLDDKIWWEDYFGCLEKEISKITNNELLSLFETDLSEIIKFKNDSTSFTSSYYILKKN